VFFLLDEILKGTNSRDRHTGAKALIRQLMASRGAGLIATHDLELGALEAEANGHIENWAIEVDIRNGELYFDYRLKRGVSKSFNATILMQQMGIKIE
ncbi:MAG: DNA mismatch repair protein MutS, partial [Bacteroidetes bacterium]